MKLSDILAVPAFYYEKNKRLNQGQRLTRSIPPRPASQGNQSILFDLFPPLEFLPFVQIAMTKKQRSTSLIVYL